MNLLNEKRDTLLKIYDEVRELEEKKEKEKEISEFQDKTEKALIAKERYVANEIAETVKEKRNGIIKTFDEEDDKLNKLLKKVAQKKDRYREGKVSERIKAETEDYIEENKSMKVEAKKKFKQSKTPSIFNTEFFYTLFMPGYLKDFLWCLFTFVVIFVGIPFFIWYFLEKPVSVYIISLIYLILILVFGGIYLIIFKSSRKYPMVTDGNNLRHKIKNNKKLIAKITKNIKKDRDDTQYGLEHYDTQLNDLSSQREELLEKRKIAIKTFDEVTRQTITDEIQNANQPEIDDYKTKLSDCTENLSSLRTDIKKITINIAENYEPFLGDVTITTISELLKIESGDTIGDIIENYKKLNADRSQA